MQNLVYLDKNGSKQNAFLDAIAIWIPRALNSANDENLSPDPQQLWHGSEDQNLFPDPQNYGMYPHVHV